MTNTEGFELILSELRGVKSEIGELKSEVGKLDNRVGKLEVEVGELRSEVKELGNRVGRLENEVEGVKAQVQELEQRMDKLDRNVTKANLLIENEVRPNIQLVAEGHLNLVRNLQDATKAGTEMEMTTIRVRVLETDVREIKEKLA